MSEPTKKLRITHDGSDYRVPAPDKREASSYYTDDLEDARNTARHMHKDPNLEVYSRRVHEHPGHNQMTDEEMNLSPRDFAFQRGPK